MGGVRAADDADYLLDGRVVPGQVVLADDCVEAAFVTMLAEFGAWNNVESRGAFALGNRHNLVAGDKLELRVRMAFLTT